MRVEERRNIADEGLGILRNAQRVAIEPDHTVIRENAQPGKGGEQNVGVLAMGSADLPDINGEIAHDPLDQRRP
ncbi:hypothetical protein CLBKND_00164 [Methylorubrum aminovorans]